MATTARELHLDYFQIYDVVNQELSGRIKICGQFDKEDRVCRLLCLDWFANPVGKNREPLCDRRAHLAGYRIYPSSPEPTRQVAVVNQFGEQRIVIGNVVALLAPSEKIERGSAFPENLSHFVVYQVLEGKPVEKRVDLKDQFGSSRAMVMNPYGFAVPVKKTYGAAVFPALNEKVHMVLYRITPRTVEKDCAVKDQFEKRKIKVIRSILLAAPTIKRRWSVRS
ncbi:MAG: hypothetical protein MUQ00_03710 [Candidatus Aminicenantes bacterium]|nr:hypothetical protein [Candidatus Aminicenantes bacterium]